MSIARAWAGGGVAALSESVEGESIPVESTRVDGEDRGLSSAPLHHRPGLEHDKEQGRGNDKIYLLLVLFRRKFIFNVLCFRFFLPALRF